MIFDGPPNRPGPWWRPGRSTGAASREAPRPSSAYPPDNVEVVTGTWGVDLDQDLTTLVSGRRSVRFNATTPSSAPSIQTERAYEVEGSRWYTATITWRSGSAVAGCTLAAVVDWYSRDNALISSSDIYAAATITAGGAFSSQRVNLQAPATARGARIRIAKAAVAFEAWLDAWGLAPTVPFGSYNKGAQAIPPSAFTTCVYDTDTEIGMSMSASGTLTVFDAGIYLVSMVFAFVTLDNAAYGIIRSAGGSWGNPSNRIYNWSGAPLTVWGSFSGLHSMSSMGTLITEAYHSSAADSDIGTRMTIARVA